MVCSTHHLIGLTGKKWTFVLLQEISLHGNDGFNVICKRMNISPKMLAHRLKELETIDIIKKDSAPLPLKTKYHLTSKGSELLALFQNFQQWNSRYTQYSCSSECTSCPRYRQSF